MIGPKANANEVALAIGISTKAVYRLMQRINDCSHIDINLLNVMKRYGPKVTHVMTESTRYIARLYSYSKGVIQKLNDME